MTVLYSQQGETFASNTLEDFLNVSEAVLNRVVGYDAQRDPQQKAFAFQHVNIQVTGP